MSATAHRDTYVLDRLPPAEQWPEFRYDLPELRYPERLNAASVLLDGAVADGHGERPALIDPSRRLTYREAVAASNRIASVLREDLGLVPGARVLVRGTNCVSTALCWYAILKAGGIAVMTMPMLRAVELETVLRRANATFALCDERLRAELDTAIERAGLGTRAVAWNDAGGAELEALAERHDGSFDDVATSAGDPAIVAFTSGTTGKPKGTVHAHRDLLASCDTFAAEHLRAGPGDVFCGTPPLAFTFGLGALLLFPARARAAALLLDAVAPEALLGAMSEYGVTICSAAPTAYRAMAPLAARHTLGGLRACVSAGETLTAATRAAWRDATGIEAIDGIGSTEMLHIFIAASGAGVRPGATGTAVRGYTAAVLDDDLQRVAPGVVGRLAVKGPTGCRYLDDERQRTYVQGGWNLTGDAYLMDDDGYFWYQARTDDMIVSSGYNIAGPEVEAALLQSALVRDCAVIGVADSERGMLVKAYVVLADEASASDDTARDLQAFVKATIAPYKYPRAIEFVSELPRTATGKLQRYVLRQNSEVAP